MWTRKDIKRGARRALKANYWRCVIVALLVMTITGSFGYLRGPGAIEAAGGAAEEVGELLDTNADSSERVDIISRNFFGQENPLLSALVKAERANQGVLAAVFNNTNSAGSFIFGILNAVNQMAFQDRVGAGIIIAVGAALSFLYWALVKNVLDVGNHRFFLENSRYPCTETSTLAYGYRCRKMWRIAGIMAARWVFNLLWFFTIAGGFIKYYAWRMVPMLLAENPNITLKEALRTSEAMMRGNKWRLFVLDLSFLGWGVLSAISFGVVNLLFAGPYRNATEAELYLLLRRQALKARPAAAGVLVDDLLAAAPEGVLEYPAELCPVPAHHTRLWLAADYRRRYIFLDYILLFFAFSMIGYIWEVGYWVVSTGDLVNRGTLYGPWLPIYGTGGVVSLFLLKRFAEKPVLTFFLAMGLCGVLEYATAWALETFLHTKWWDYTGYFLNIQGRVCLEGLIVFGLGCCLGIYLLSPTLAGLFDKIPKKGRVTLAAVLCAAFAGDAAFSAVQPNMAAGESVK